VLFVGVERPDEFADIWRLACRGHDVMAVNPRETDAARSFRARGGNFVRARIEDLPQEHCRFDVVCENYPYPSGRHYVPPRPFALARMSRLAPGGRWILFTESARFASLLKAVGDNDTPGGEYQATLASVHSVAAPPSAYPPVDSRFRLIVERQGAICRRAP
jgi:hypothetical protein